MPQGKRKVVFSAKQKKMQLQQRKERKNAAMHPKCDTIVHQLGSILDSFDDVEVLNQQPATSGSHNPNRYRLIFKKEKNEDIQKRIEMSREPFEQLSESALEVGIEEVYVPGIKLDMPKRPCWDFSCSKAQLEAREQKYFREYLANLESRLADQEYIHFEMNLETWRQLWRVLEFSDIVLQVIDIRFPVYHFSPSLYDYVVNDLKKNMIIVLNKVDLVPAPLVLAWQEYFKKHFPMLKVMCFASYAGMIVKEGKRGRRIGNLHMAVAGARSLLRICEDIVGDKVDLSSWKQKVDTESSQIGADGEEYIDSEPEMDGNEDSKIVKTNAVENDTSPYSGEKYRDNMLTVGFVGHPNVGKSSFLNAICGKKVVSVSRTPGHTKHYQTIMLTKNVRLCDCPGLVFPALASKSIQVLMGCYPIAQMREPYSAIAFLGARVPLQKILKLKHPEAEDRKPGEELKWSAWDICEAWAIKRGFHTAKTSRPDVYRAANNILRMSLDGRTLCLAFYPPNFTKEKEMWEKHPGLPEILAVQAHRVKDVEALRENVKSIKIAEDTEEYESESEEEEDSRNDEADSEDSTESPSSDNKFKLLAEDVM